MKVLHVLNGFKNGGIESLAIQLIKHAPITVENCLLNANRREQGMSTFFRNLKSNNYLSKILEWEECDGIVLFVKTFLLCLKIRPDSILIYPFNRPMLLVAFAARLAGVKRIAITVQNTAPKSLSSQRKWATLLFWFNRLKILVVPCTKAIINSIQPYSARTVLSEVIHNGCDTQDISSRANITRRKRTPNDSLRVIMVSRLDTIKDQTTLIKAFNRVKQANWKLQLVGEGSKRKELESIICQTCEKVKINLKIFPNTPPEPFWTGDKNFWQPKYNWIVNFYNGNTFGRYPSYKPNYIRLVRDRN